jgi:hypothetical protein
MAEDRPEKSVVRALWVEEALRYSQQYPNDEDPLFLTLAGAEGKDVRALVQAGLVRTSENNAIAAEHLGKVVAVEHSPPAVLHLQSRFPGLKILEVPFHNLVRGTGPITWPGKNEVQYCRARVVNLDLDTSLHANDENNEVQFPELVWISKLSQLHAIHPRREWSLCLTLQGSLQLPDTAVEFCTKFLCENFTREPRLAKFCEQFWGEAIFQSIAEAKSQNWSGFPIENQQQLLMVFVPKLISHLVYQHGWRVRTHHNLRYGGGHSAPMVTWVIRFDFDPNTQATPDALYRDALRNILKAAGVVTSAGIVPTPLSSN